MVKTPQQGWRPGQDREYKFQSRGSAAVKKHNRLSILKCSDVLHYNKNVTRGLCVRGNIVRIARALAATYILLQTAAWGPGIIWYPVKTAYGEKTIFGHKKYIYKKKPPKNPSSLIYASLSINKKKKKHRNIVLHRWIWKMPYIPAERRV